MLYLLLLQHIITINIICSCCYCIIFYRKSYQFHQQMWLTVINLLWNRTLTLFESLTWDTEWGGVKEQTQETKRLTQWRTSTHRWLFCRKGSNLAHEWNLAEFLFAVLTKVWKYTLGKWGAGHSNMPWGRAVPHQTAQCWRWSLACFQWRSCSCPQRQERLDKTVVAGAGNRQDPLKSRWHKSM